MNRYRFYNSLSSLDPFKVNVVINDRTEMAVSYRWPSTYHSFLVNAHKITRHIGDPKYVTRLQFRTKHVIVVYARKHGGTSSVWLQEIMTSIAIEAEAQLPLISNDCLTSCPTVFSLFACRQIVSERGSKIL